MSFFPLDGVAALNPGTLALDDRHQALDLEAGRRPRFLCHLATISSFTTPGEVGKSSTERAGPLASPPEVSIRGQRLGLHFGVIRSLSRQLCQPPMGTTLGLLIYPQIPATHPSHAILFRKYCHLLRQLIPWFCHSGDLESGLSSSTSWCEFGQVTGTLQSVISCVCRPSSSGSSGGGFGPGLCQTPVLTLVYSR